MRFGDFLKATVLLSAASATLLAALTVIGISRQLEDTAAYVSAGWWIIATLIGTISGRAKARRRRSRGCWPAPAPALAARTCSPARTIFNRLWPLLVCTLVAGVLSFFAPQIGGIAAGFAIIWALAWRRQEAAVAAIEERDGARFYVDRTSPLSAIRLIRTPGFGGDFLHTRA